MLFQPFPLIPLLTALNFASYFVSNGKDVLFNAHVFKIYASNESEERRNRKRTFFFKRASWRLEKFSFFILFKFCIFLNNEIIYYFILEWD